MFRVVVFYLTIVRKGFEDVPDEIVALPQRQIQIEPASQEHPDHPSCCNGVEHVDPLFLVNPRPESPAGEGETAAPGPPRYDRPYPATSLRSSEDCPRTCPVTLWGAFSSLLSLIRGRSTSMARPTKRAARRIPMMAITITENIRVSRLQYNCRKDLAFLKYSKVFLDTFTLAG